MSIGHHIVVQGTVGFNVGNWYVVGFCYLTEYPNLMLHQRYNFAGRQVHGATAKANRIRVTGVGADGDIVLLGCEQCFLHKAVIASVKTAGDTGLIDKWHYLIVEAGYLGFGAFAEIAI
jgi:hypothetical protein